MGYPRLYSHLDIASLLVFLEIAERGSINSAAKHLNISQPALTRTVRQLELALGSDLFARSAKGVTLLPLGERLLRHARIIRAESRNAYQVAQDFRLDGAVSIRIGIAAVYVLDLLARALAKLTAANPKLTVQCVSGTQSDLTRALRDGEIELMLGPIERGQANDAYHRDVIHDDAMAVFARAGHSLFAAGSIDVGQLMSTEWTLGPPGTPSRAQAAALFQHAGLQTPAVRLEIEAVPLRRAIVQATDYLSIFQTYQMHEALAAGMVRRLDLHWPQDSIVIGALRLGSHSPMSTAVVEALAAEYVAAGLGVAA